MRAPLFIVGPTAVGKTEIAAAVARLCDGEVVSADAFQIYRGLDLLTAKPEPEILRSVPHHLIGVAELSEEMNAEKFRTRALAAIDQIHARGKPVIVVGGSGMYVQALTHGLSPLPVADRGLRQRLEQLSVRELFVRLTRLDPETAGSVGRYNKHRLLRAVEICLLTGRPASEQRTRPTPANQPTGVMLSRERAELKARIDSRVEAMFANGVVQEVRAAGEVGPTAVKTLGLREIRALLSGEISEAECIASIQQATRRYAKRQLTWFRGQTNFETLNLSLHGSAEAIELISRKARLSFTPQDD